MSIEHDRLFHAIEDIRAAVGSKPVPGTLFNVAGIESPDVVVWADSPQAAAAILEAGYPQTVALVPEAGRDLFAPLRGHAALLGDLRKVVLAGGSHEHVEELARRLGRHRCWRVKWPGGCADACATMQHHGIGAVRNAIEAAEPYPIEGLHKPTPVAMLDFRHSPPPHVMSTGCGATDSILKFPGEGKLIVITGVPNHGKSTWLTHVMAHTAHEHARRWAVFSPEMGEWQHLAAQVMAWRSQKPFRPFKGQQSMTDKEILEGGTWCNTRFNFFSCDSEDVSPTLDWIMSLARACILRDGTTDLLIDPWNEIEHSESGLSETQYIGRSLQRLRVFANRHGCNIWIVAHPTKLKPLKPGEPTPVPTAYDVNGGANWANKADMILVVHCPDTVTQVHLLKARFRRWGRRGAVAELELDPVTGRFRSASVPDAMRDPEPG